MCVHVCMCLRVRVCEGVKSYSRTATCVSLCVFLRILRYILEKQSHLRAELPWVGMCVYDSAGR